MTEAVIVATARSPIGRANKGSLVSLRPDDMSAQILQALLAKAPQVQAGDINDVMWGIGQPFMGAIADRFGTLRVLWVGALLYAAVLGLLGFVSVASVWSFPALWPQRVSLEAWTAVRDSLPVLADTAWDDVFVTEAVSPDGVQLQLSLRPHRDQAVEATLAFTQLQPGAEYVRVDARKIALLMDLAGEVGLACGAVAHHPEVEGLDLGANDALAVARTVATYLTTGAGGAWLEEGGDGSIRGISLWNQNAGPFLVRSLNLKPTDATPRCVADVDDGSFTGTRDQGVTIDDLIYYLYEFEMGFADADIDDDTRPSADSARAVPTPRPPRLRIGCPAGNADNARLSQPDVARPTPGRPLSSTSCPSKCERSR